MLAFELGFFAISEVNVILPRMKLFNGQQK